MTTCPEIARIQALEKVAHSPRDMTKLIEGINARLELLERRLDDLVDEQRRLMLRKGKGAK